MLVFSIITLFRTIVPLLIFKFTFSGIILSFFLDSIDWDLINKYSGRNIYLYQGWDKFLDIYMSVVFLFYLIKKWKKSKLVFIALLFFILRITGDFLFELTAKRAMLFAFPDIFDNFFIFIEACRKMDKRLNMFTSNKVLSFTTGIVIFFKLVQEYIIHIVQVYPWQLKFGQIIAETRSFYRYINISIWTSIFVIVQTVILWIVIVKSKKAR